MESKTKILCTIGPSTRGVDKLKELIQAGMDAARLNFSHGTHEQHLNNIRDIRDAAIQTNRQIAIVQDLQGPKIRTGKVTNGAVELKDGSEFIITTDDLDTGDEHRVSTGYKELASELKKNNTILLDDGYIILKTKNVKGNDIITEVVKGGTLKDNKGIITPGVPSKAPSLSKKDMADLKFGLENGVDAVALSFVRSKNDIIELRSVMKVYGRVVPIIAKIERYEACEVIDEIIQETDMIMVARGDLGLEMPAEKVPVLQKEIIGLSNSYGRPVITATQMLESMIKNPRPTRAEASDVANAVLDGTDCVMLSGETSVGDYPVEAVTYMDKIIHSIEEKYIGAFKKDFELKKLKEGEDISDALGKAACLLAQQIKAKAIIAFTGSGSTTQYVAKYRPPQPIIALTDKEETLKFLNMIWGVRPVLLGDVDGESDIFAACISRIQDMHILEDDDYVVFIAGLTEGKILPGNMLKVYRI